MWRPRWRQAYPAVPAEESSDTMTVDAAQVLEVIIPDELAGRRLDQALTELLAGRSRAQVQKWIRDGRTQVDGRTLRPSDKVAGGERVTVRVPAPEPAAWRAQAIPLDIVHEDDEILVLNKPPGLVVHPGAGNPEGTLLNALLSHAPGLATLARAGIVHRLDKETSGLMVVARTEAARLDLIEQLRARSVTREYLAIVGGRIVAGGSVEAPIGRHRTQRTRMAVTGAGKPAITHYRVEARYRAHTLLRVRLESGRTHQIRVHMAHLKHPVLGDPVYGGRLMQPAGASSTLLEALRGFRRQALHAAELGLVHPNSGEAMRFHAPPPADLVRLMDILRADAQASRDAGP